jgi:DNA-binding CsgD family transcriptional regulator
MQTGELSFGGTFPDMTITVDRNSALSALRGRPSIGQVVIARYRMGGIRTSRVKATSNESDAQRCVLDKGMLITDSSLNVIACDAGATAILRSAEPGSDAPVGDISLPPEIVEPLVRRDPADFSPIGRYLQRGKHRYSCRAYILQAWHNSPFEGLVAIHLQRAPCADDVICEVASQYSLTDRETEVLSGVAAGLTSKELADKMNIRPNTVKAFLRLIMIKMGVTTRSGILGLVLKHDESESDLLNRSL